MQRWRREVEVLPLNLLSSLAFSTCQTDKTAKAVNNLLRAKSTANCLFVMDYRAHVGRCLWFYFIAVLMDAVGLILFFIGIFAPLSFWDFLVFSGPLLIFLSLIFWISWYLGNLEAPLEELLPRWEATLPWNKWELQQQVQNVTFKLRYYPDMAARKCASFFHLEFLIDNHSKGKTSPEMDNFAGNGQLTS